MSTMTLEPPQPRPQPQPQPRPQQGNPANVGQCKKLRDQKRELARTLRDIASQINILADELNNGADETGNMLGHVSEYAPGEYDKFNRLYKDVKARLIPVDKMFQDLDCDNLLNDSEYGPYGFR